MDSFITWWVANWPGFQHWLTEGNAPDWATGVVALIALNWARKAALAARDTYEVQAKQVRDLEEERRSEQADQFTASVRFLETGHHYEADNISKPEIIVIPDTCFLHYEVRNGSHLIIRDVTFYIPGDVEYFVTHLDTVPPSGESRYGGRVYFAAKEVAQPVRLGSLFIDAQRQHWDRRPHGELVHLTAKQYHQRLVVMANNSRRLADSIEWPRLEHRDSLHDASYRRLRDNE